MLFRSAQSAQLLQFQSEAGVAVPENADFLRSRLTSLQDRRTVRTAEIERLEEQKVRLTELFERTGGVDLGDGNVTPLEGQLAAARRELLDAQVIFSPQNPKIRVLQARVEQLEQRVAQAADDTARRATEMTGTEFSQARILFDAQMEEIDAQLVDLRENLEGIEAEIEVVSEQITQATQNGFTIAKLERDLDGIRSDFERARNRLSAAETGERIELLAKGQRISVIEQALVPGSPISPNRPLIAASGVGGGIFVALGLIVLLELLNKSIRRPVELTNRLGITPIGVVPYIRTDREIAFKRTVVIGFAILMVVGLPAMLLAVHTLVTPLDRLIEPLLNRIGFSIG